MSESETTKSRVMDWPAALQWAIGSAVANTVIALFLGFWQGTSSMSIGGIVGTSVVVGIVNGATTAQYATALLPYARLRAIHWLGVAVIAAPLGLLWSSLFDVTFLMGAALNYSTAVVIGGIPIGYVVVGCWTSRPIAPQGHPDNILG